MATEVEPCCICSGCGSSGRSPENPLGEDRRCKMCREANHGEIQKEGHLPDYSLRTKQGYFYLYGTQLIDRSDWASQCNEYWEEVRERKEMKAS